MRQNETKLFSSIQTIYQNSEITSLTFFNYNYLVVGFVDSTVKYWNILNIFHEYPTLNYHSQAITCLFNLYNQYLFSGSLDRKIVVYDSNLNKYDELTVHKGKINSIVYLVNQSYLVTSSYDTSIIYWKTVSNLTQINQLNSELTQWLNKASFTHGPAKAIISPYDYLNNKFHF